MSVPPKGEVRSPAKDIAVAVLVAFAVTVTASFAIFPFAIELVRYISIFGSFALSIVFPILCDVYVARRFFSTRAPASRYALVAIGVFLSVVLAFLIWEAFIMFLFSAAVVWTL